MTDSTDPTVTIHVDDQVLFRLREGAHPLVYPDMITRVSYEVGVDVLHTGAVWAAGYLDDVEVLELDDSTVVAIADIDPDSFVIPREASARDGDS